MTDPIAPVTIVKGAEISGIRMQVAEDASLKKLWRRDAWYQVGWSEDVTMSAPLARTVLDEPLLVFRNVEGRVAALLDRCPHRFAPLSAGKIENGTVTCGYHGLAFRYSRCLRAKSTRGDFRAHAS